MNSSGCADLGRNLWERFIFRATACELRIAVDPCAHALPIVDEHRRIADASVRTERVFGVGPQADNPHGCKGARDQYRSP